MLNQSAVAFLDVLSKDYLIGAVYDCEYRKMESGFSDLYGQFKRGSADIESIITQLHWKIECHLERAKKFNPIPYFGTGIAILELVIKQLKTNKNVQCCNELIEFGLLLGIETCEPPYALSDIYDKLYKLTSQLREKGIDPDTYFSIF